MNDISDFSNMNDEKAYKAVMGQLEEMYDGNEVIVTAFIKVIYLPQVKN